MMRLTTSYLSTSLLLLFSATTTAQYDWGYEGYSLAQEGDPSSASYSTHNTPPAPNLTAGPPDVFLNATVHVGFIGIDVQDLTAKVNIDAKVLHLLTFNAGLDLQIDRVRLSIENVDARVTLQARLGNLVLMIRDVLDSLDLNPIISELGNGVGTITNAVRDVLAPGVSKRDMLVEDWTLRNNILFSINDYSGSAHTNRVLAQNGDVVDQDLDDSGNVRAVRVVGGYESVMQSTGQSRKVVYENVEADEAEYVYEPFPGVKKVAVVFVDETRRVTGFVVLII